MTQTNKAEMLAIGNEKYNATFPTRLRGLLDNSNGIQKVLKLTRQGLAEHLGVSPQQVSNYTTGKTIPDANCLREIAKYLGVSTDYLLGLTDTQTPYVEERAIYEITGLHESCIWFLHNQLSRLLELTNTETPKAAMEIQQKMLSFLSSKRRNDEEIISYARKLGLREQAAGFDNILDVAKALTETPAFQTINTLVDDRQVNIEGSVLQALERIFQQEKQSDNIKYAIISIQDSSVQLVYDSIFTSCFPKEDNDCVYNLRLVDLQNTLFRHRNDYRKLHKQG